MATLLLADDSVTIQRVIELTFANEDVRVVAVGDGQAALQKLEADRPDIVLADVGMPKLDGYAVARHIKQSPELRNIPVLLLTGAFEPVDEDQARAAGCDGILVKPVEPQQLIGRVKELLAGRRDPALWPAGMSRAEPAVAAERPLETPDDSAPLDIDFSQMGGSLDEIDPVLPPVSLEAGADELTREIARLRGPIDERPSAAGEHFGDWDIPRTGARHDAASEPIALDLSEPEPVPAAPEQRATVPEPPAQPVPVPAAMAPLTLPVASPAPLPQAAPAAAPVAVPVASAPPATVLPPPSAPPSGGSRLSLATAFSALLAAEQSAAGGAAPRAAAPAAAGTPVSEAAIEEMVHRVVTRMTEDTVRRIVLETAERLIREEIEKIKLKPD